MAPAGDFGEASRTRHAEIEAWRRADVCAAVTDDDRRAMLRAASDLDVRVVSDGVDARTFDVEVPLRHGLTTLFVGNFAYEPNLDGARWLLDDVWPRVRARPRLQFVGNDAPAALGRPGVRVRGRVPSLEPYYGAAEIVLCPLRVGGGIKVKMLEALARGKAIVSTTVGIQGLPGAPVLVRDDGAGFAAAVEALVRDRAERGRLGEAAASYARRLPTWDDAAQILLRCYEELSRAKSAAWPWPTPTQSVARP